MSRAALLRRQRGLSMIEVVVVVAIVGILALVVSPEISTQLRNARIRNAADAMQAGLLRARAEAISRNQNVRFSLVSDLSGSCSLSAAAGSWVVSLNDPDGKCDTTPDPTVDPGILAVHTARDGNAGAVIAAMRSDGTTAATSVTFNPFGRVINVNQMARIVVTNASSPADYRSYRVDISTVGSVRMCDVRVSTASDDPRRCLT
jgi:type IV fimbrial biogenesis protein FimT